MKRKFGSMEELRRAQGFQLKRRVPVLFDAAAQFWRGPKPSCSEDLAPFKRVISLQSETVEAPYVWAEKAWCEDRGIKFHHVAMSLISPPTKEQLDEVLGLLSLGSADIGGPTLVHCAEGVDRTGLAVAYYKSHFGGLSFGQVIGEAIDKGFHLDRYCWWLPVVREHFCWPHRDPSPT